MAVPWLRILNAAIGATDIARRVMRRGPAGTGEDNVLAAGSRPGGPLEAQLAGVVVAALKEAFNRDHQRLELERDHFEAERQRAERALRLELLQKAADREVARLRLLAGVAVVSWLGTLFFATRLIEGAGVARAALAIGWLLLLAALAAAFSAQSYVGRRLAQVEGRAAGADEVSSGLAGALAPWLIVAGLAVVGISVLL